jgi:hypothetical protein
VTPRIYIHHSLLYPNHLSRLSFLQEWFFLFVVGVGVEVSLRSEKTDVRSPKYDFDILLIVIIKIFIE